MEVVLYHAPRACSSVTMNALEELGLPYEDRVVNIFKGEQKRPEYLAIHPGGKVPALVIDNTVLTENAAMLMYLDMLHPGRLLPTPSDPLKKAQQYADLVWCSGTFHPAVRQVRMPIHYTDGDPGGVQANGVEKVHGLMKIMSERLAEQDWWHGDQWSITDVYLNWLCTIALVSGLPMDQYPKALAHGERVRARPSFQRAMARQGAAEKRAGIEFPPPVAAAPGT